MALRSTSPRSGLRADRSPERPLTVLVIEDNALVRRMTTEFLASYGCEVMTVGDGASARDAISYADAAIVDVGLPDCSGADLVEEIRWSDADLPVIVATARVDQELRDRFSADPNTHFLAKPFTEDQLRRAIEALKQRARAA